MGGFSATATIASTATLTFFSICLKIKNPGSKARVVNFFLNNHQAFKRNLLTTAADAI